MIRDNFAVFILTHGRPDKICTLKVLRRFGYTGKYYIILDNEDPTIERHKELFGEEHVIVFDKAAVAEKFDIYDNFDGRNVVVFARNVCFDIARELGLDYFAEFEDDYSEFRFRIQDGNSLRAIYIDELDPVFEAMLDCLDDTGIRTVAMAQSGEMIGGITGGVWRSKLKRKAMNTFFFKVGKPEDDIQFVGRFNDDVNTYTTLGQRGEIFLQICNATMTQEETQAKEGGNTEAYKKYGTYIKSFYTVMACPNSVTIQLFGATHPRLHHHIDWETCVPKIISDRFKK